MRCPACHSGRFEEESVKQELRCFNCNCIFPVVSGRPVLIRRDNQLFSVSDYVQAAPVRGLHALLSKAVPSPSVNLARTSVLRSLARLIDSHTSSTILVVGSGYQRRDLTNIFGSLRRVRLLCTDVSRTADVDIFCDAHELPFDDGSFDALITTAVLEHVLYPERVALELHRVLKEGGLIYSEIPFIQQVHEGAYDFTRFTLSGHRRLLNHFREIQSGMVAGPATALVWSIEHFVVGFSRHRFVRLLLKTLARYAFFWIKYFDFFLQRRLAALDGASCTYFLGSRSTRITPDVDIIAGYKGAGAPNSPT